MEAPGLVRMRYPNSRVAMTWVRRATPQDGHCEDDDAPPQKTDYAAKIPQCVHRGEDSKLL